MAYIAVLPFIHTVSDTVPECQGVFYYACRSIGILISVVQKEHPILQEGSPVEGGFHIEDLEVRKFVIIFHGTAFLDLLQRAFAVAHIIRGHGVRRTSRKRMLFAGRWVRRHAKRI